MAFASRVPSTVDELHEHMMKLYEGRSHIKSVKVNSTTHAIEVDLDWAANNIGGVEDFQLPLKPDKMSEASTYVAMLRRDFEAGHEPNRSLSEKLYYCIKTRTVQ